MFAKVGEASQRLRAKTTTLSQLAALKQKLSVLEAEIQKTKKVKEMAKLQTGVDWLGKT